MKFAAAALASLLSVPAGGADTWKWVDGGGGVHYGAQPPAGVAASRVHVAPQAAPDSAHCASIQCQWERMSAARQAQEAAAPPPSATVERPARGMAFEVYMRLDRGMSEGELLTRAGPPDRESLDGYQESSRSLATLRREAGSGLALSRGLRDGTISTTSVSVVKTWYYLPTVGDPFTTTITLRGGRIASIERERRF